MCYPSLRVAYVARVPGTKGQSEGTWPSYKLRWAEGKWEKYVGQTSWKEDGLKRRGIMPRMP